MNFIKNPLMLLVPLSLAACSSLQSHGYIQNRATDYLNARSIAPLNIPPGVSSSTIRAEYPVSDHSYPGPKDVTLIPPGLNTASK